MSATTQCSKWKMVDALHWNGLCTNAFRRVYDAHSEVSGDCEICVNPSIEYHTPCCCPAPKTSQRVLRLTSTQIGSTPMYCQFAASFGTFLLYGNDCGFASNEKRVTNTHSGGFPPFPGTCVVLPGSAQMWVLTPVSCFDVGSNKFMSCQLRYFYGTMAGSPIPLPVSNSLLFNGQIPACNDVDGSWVFNNVASPDWGIVISSL